MSVFAHSAWADGHALSSSPRYRRLPINAATPPNRCIACTSSRVCHQLRMPSPNLSDSAGDFWELGAIVPIALAPHH
eukprot:365123-Chlamydomonas_euryale.AAC.45